MAMKQFKPVEKNFFFDYIVPLHGVVSYAALYTRILFPKALEALVDEDYAQIYAGSVILCTTVGIYRRSFLSAVPRVRRSLYAVTGGTMFSLTTMYMWTIIKSLLPKNCNNKVLALTLTSGLITAKLGRDYFTIMDNMVEKRIKDAIAAGVDDDEKDVGGGGDGNGYGDGDGDGDNISDEANSDYTTEYSTDDLN